MFHFRLVFFLCCGTTQQPLRWFIACEHHNRHDRLSAHQPIVLFRLFDHPRLQVSLAQVVAEFWGLGMWPQNIELQIPTVLPQKKGRGIGFMPFLAMGCRCWWGGNRDTYCHYCWILLKVLESQQIPDYRGKDGKLQKRGQQTDREGSKHLKAKGLFKGLLFKGGQA